MKITADTNVLVRAAVKDDPAQGEAAAKLLREAELVAVPTPVLCEFAWVLGRAYRRPANEIVSSIRSLLATESVVTNMPAVSAGLAFLEAGGDFADGVIAYEGSGLGGEAVATFDRQALTLARTLGIAAVMPGGASR